VAGQGQGRLRTKEGLRLTDSAVNEELVDRAGSIRTGEELDLDSLRQHLEPVLGAKVAQLEVKQFPGGFSNLTYLLSSGDERWVLRRPPFGSKVKSAHDMSREFKILSALQGVFPYGPKPVHFCDDHAVLGCDFYLMSYIEGLVIRREYPAALNFSPDQIREQLFNFLMFCPSFIPSISSRQVSIPLGAQRAMFSDRSTVGVSGGSML